MMPPERIKYPSIPVLSGGETLLRSPNLQVYEKLDGGNCQLRNRSGVLFPATRSGNYAAKVSPRCWLGDLRSWAYSFYNDYQEKLFATLPDLLPENLILFGEWLAPHTIEYDSEKINDFYLIDVYDLKKERFLPYEKGAKLATIDGLLEMNTLRTLHKGPVTEKQLLSLMHKSDYYDGLMEGVVIKDYVTQSFAKFLHPDYQEFARDKNGLDAYLTLRRLVKVKQGLYFSTHALNPASLKAKFLQDIKKEAPKALIDDRIIDKWLAANIPKILK